MKSWFTLGTWNRLPVRGHYSWLFVLIGGLWSLARVLLPERYTTVGASFWVAAAVMMVGYVVSVVVHEAAHLLVARWLRVPWTAVNLHPIGTLARLAREAAGPQRSILIALAGPAINLLLWWLLERAVQDAAPTTLIVVLQYVAWFNLLLALVNLLPGLPLDGGRVLRAIVWYMTGNFQAGTRIATYAGYGVVALVALRGLMLLSGTGPEAWVLGLWTILLAWMIYEAGTALLRRRTLGALFTRLTARQVMTETLTTVAPNTSLRDVSVLWRGSSGQNPTPVVENHALVGMITRAHLADIPQGYWDTRTAGQAMTPASELKVVAPEASLEEVLALLDPDALDPAPIPVVDDGRLIGAVEPWAVVELVDVQETMAMRPHVPTVALGPTTEVEAEPAVTEPPPPGKSS